jgi:hypothetical protein
MAEPGSSPPPPASNAPPPTRPATRVKPTKRSATTRPRGPTKKQTAAWWRAQRAVIAARGGPVRETRIDGKPLFALFAHTGATAAGLLEKLPKCTGLRRPPLLEKTPFQKHRDMCISAFYADNKAQIPEFCAPMLDVGVVSAASAAADPNITFGDKPAEGA